MDARTPVFPNYARKSVEVAASRLIRKGCFSPDDFDDIRSQLMVYTLRQLGRHNSHMAKLSTFVSMVVNDAAKLVLRNHLAGKRQLQRAAVSLDIPVDQGDADEDLAVADLVDGQAAAADLGYGAHSPHDEANLRLDVGTVLSLLPEPLRECCAAIMDGSSISDLAREKGLSRSTFRDQVMAPIRHAFESAGMGTRASARSRKSAAGSASQDLSRRENR
ncbi:MAG: hypothetical protein GX595_11320 [Lentisphaerae bacterium]|nr:hypothetical protein [Lentisphaerota bacterium]